MSSYRSHKFMLTQNQLKKVKKALEEDKPISITIPENNFNGEVPLPLTDTELQKIHDGEGIVKVTLSKKKLQHIRDEKEGGFLQYLPMVLKGIGAIGAAVTGVSSIASAVNKNKTDAAALEEQARHNREIESRLGEKKGDGLPL